MLLFTCNGFPVVCASFVLVVIDCLRYFLFQGAIEDGEEPKSAALRELQEETGVVSAEIIAEVCIERWCFYALGSFLSNFTAMSGTINALSTI